MITLFQYFGEKDRSEEQTLAAAVLLDRVNALIDEAAAEGKFTPRANPHTQTEISGSKGGAGDGGFRTPQSTTGAPGSSHKEAKAVDVYDPGDILDAWLDTFEENGGLNSILEKHNLYREASKHTPGWCHLTTRSPRSGVRSFNI